MDLEEICLILDEVGEQHDDVLLLFGDQTEEGFEDQTEDFHILLEHEGEDDVWLELEIFDDENGGDDELELRGC